MPMAESGTTAEALGFHAGTFTPRKVEKVLRYMLIRAQKTCEQGKLAEIEGEDGVITLTSTIATDDTANM